MLFTSLCRQQAIVHASVFQSGIPSSLMLCNYRLRQAISGQGENEPHKYIPLLNNMQEIHPELVVKLNNLSRPGTKNRRDRLKKTQNRTSRANSSKPESKARPSSSERASKSRQGK